MKPLTDSCFSYTSARSRFIQSKVRHRLRTLCSVWMETGTMARRVENRSTRELRQDSSNTEEVSNAGVGVTTTVQPIMRLRFSSGMAMIQSPSWTCEHCEVEDSSSERVYCVNCCVSHSHRSHSPRAPVSPGSTRTVPARSSRHAESPSWRQRSRMARALTSTLGSSEIRITQRSFVEEQISLEGAGLARGLPSR